MLTEIELKQKVKKMFLSYPEHEGLTGVYPEGPLKIVDDAMNRCFRFYDRNNKEFFFISVVEKQFLPQEIKRYFHMKISERQSVAKLEIEKCIRNSSMSLDEMVATDIVESLRQWANSN